MFQLTFNFILRTLIMLRLYSYILRLYSYTLLIIVTDQSARSNFHDFLLFGFFYVFLSDAVYTKLVKPEFGTINLYIQYLYTMYLYISPV